MGSWSLKIRCIFNRRFSDGLPGLPHRHGFRICPYAGGVRCGTHGRRQYSRTNTSPLIAIYDHVEVLEYTQAHWLSGILLVFSFLILLLVYTVKGTVKLSSAGAGKENIRIEWRVLDPNGKNLGTVSQQNTIPKGSLNGPWGAIADAAAGAAADKLKKFLPKSS